MGHRLVCGRRTILCLARGGLNLLRSGNHWAGLRRRLVLRSGVVGVVLGFSCRLLWSGSLRLILWLRLIGRLRWRWFVLRFHRRWRCLGLPRGLRLSTTHCHGLGLYKYVYGRQTVRTSCGYIFFARLTGHAERVLAFGTFYFNRLHVVLFLLFCVSLGGACVEVGLC